MTIITLFRHLPLLLLLALPAVGMVIASGLGSPTYAQDDDGGDDDGGDDDGGDDDGGDDDGGVGASGSPEGRDAPATRTSRTAPPETVRRTQALPADATPLPTRAPDQIVVSGLTDADLAALVAEGFVVIETVTVVRNGPRLHRLRLPSGVALEVGRDRVRALESGQNADFNHYYRSVQADAVETDATAAPECKHLNCGIAEQVGWPVSRPPGCRAEIDIGVIDTAINLEHAGLVGARIELVRLTGDLPPSGESHGTAVVSLLVGLEDRAPGLVPEARIVAVDVFTREGGDERADVVHLVQALDLLADRGLRVANMSLAGPENTVLTDMMASVAEGGMLVVAAAGNGGPAAPPAWPAAAKTAVAVTAVDAAGRVYRQAQRGDHLDLAAPGVEVWSAASVRGVRPKTGTSFAAPFVTATAAIMMSRDPAMTPAAARDALRSHTRDLGKQGEDDVFGVGLLNLGGLCASL